MQSYCGGRLDLINKHIGCEHNIISYSEEKTYQCLKVNSFHNGCIKKGLLAEQLKAHYFHEDGTIEAAFHKDLPWIAIMWHPERAGTGMELANRW